MVVILSGSNDNELFGLFGRCFRRGKFRPTLFCPLHNCRGSVGVQCGGINRAACATALLHSFFDAVGQVVHLIAEVRFGFVHLLDLGECVNDG